MNPELVNIYIERLIKEIEELTKNRLLVETQLKYYEGLNNALATKITDLESQIEKQNKKVAKKDDETF